MATVECVNCKQEISSYAKACPNCGAKIKNSSLVAIGISGLFILFIAATAFNTPPSATKKASDQTSDREKLEKTMRDEQARLADQCKNGYQSSCDSEKLHTQMMNAAGIY